MRDLAIPALLTLVSFFVADFRRYKQEQKARRAAGESLYERRKGSH